MLIGSTTVASAAKYSNFNREGAANYAKTYANSSNKIYKELDADCTNFVSQAIAHGGVISYTSSFKKKPTLYKDWIMETNSNAWYMIKKSRSIGYDYWVYSKSWAFVGDFYNFHVNRAAKNANFSGNLSGKTPNTTLNENKNFEYKLRKNAKVGQVWQLDNKHSIIITKVAKMKDGYNYVWFSAHTNSQKDQDIQLFLDFCWANGGKIHSLDFTA